MSRLRFVRIQVLGRAGRLKTGLEDRRTHFKTGLNPFAWRLQQKRFHLTLDQDMAYFLVILSVAEDLQILRLLCFLKVTKGR